MDSYDTVIIGGGPVGSRVAEIIAENGFSTMILEEHREIGKPVQCSGLVSKNVIDLSEIGKKSVIMPLKRAEIIAGETKLSIESNNERVFLIDRSIFDKEMARKALKKGAEIRMGARAESFKRKGGKIEVLGNHEGEKLRVETNLVIGADGLYSITARNFGLDRPKEILGALQFHIAEEVEEIKIFPEPENTFFSWQIPLPEGSLIGTATPHGNAAKILRKRFGNFEKKSVSMYGGGIPLGYLKNIADDNIMIVGDAAAQVKPLSGGGLYPGLIAANIAGKIAVKSLENGDFSRKTLSAYQKEWVNSVGKEIRNGMLLRKIYSNISEKDVEKVLSALKDKKLIEIIEKEGDIDHPSALARSLIKASPKLLVFSRYLSGLLV